MKLHERLAELRREHQITLRELRDRIQERTGTKLSISYLSELERTESAPPVETLARIAGGYGITLPDLLASVDFFEPPTGAQYPAGLRALADKEGLDPDWLAALARIEFRGHRPQTEDEWRAIYAMLKAFIEPKLKG
jgi:transcriptional regulator with XRE-family HTH domain